MKKFLLPIFIFTASINANAQCAMCRAALENSDGPIKAEGVNDGIMYLMVFPYLLIGLVGYAVYRMRQKKKAKQEAL
jgi:hypothetical protein